jgi:hypothetical protein
MGVARNLALVLVASAVTGCAVLLDLDDARTRQATEGEETGAGSDAGTDGVIFDTTGLDTTGLDTAALDTTALDTTALDGGPTEAAADSATPDAAETSVSKCPDPTAKLCLDFESGTLASLPVAIVRSSAGETVDFTDEAKAGARAIRCEHVGGSTTGERFAQLVTEYPNWKPTTLELDAKISVTGSVSAGAPIEIASIYFFPKPGSDFVYQTVYLESSGVAVYTQTTGGGGANYKVVGSLPSASSWIHLRLKATPPSGGATGTGTFELEIDGVAKYSGSVNFNVAPDVNATTKIQVGVRRFSGTTPAVKMLVDDLVIRH